jgi:hypothetical protein
MRSKLALAATLFSLGISGHVLAQSAATFAGSARPVGTPAPVSTTSGGVRVQVPTPSGASNGGTTSQVGGSSVRFGPPAYAPQRLDLKDVWDGGSTRATLTFTANAPGKTTASLPNGPFRVSEMRVMSQGGATSTTFAVAKTARARQSTPPWEITSSAGEEIQIDVTFEPKFDLFSMGAGPKSAVLVVKGPGPQIPWQMNVPVAGVFNGKRLGVGFVANGSDIPAVQGDSQVVIPVTLFGTGTPTSGNLRAKTSPPGTAFSARPVTLAANETQKLQLPLSINSALSYDGTPRQVELVYEYGGGSSTAATTIVPLPTSVTRQTGMRTDCGVQKLHALITLSLKPDHSEATGNVQLTAFNNDPTSAKNIWVELASNGQGMWCGIVDTGRGNLLNPTQGFRREPFYVPVSVNTYAEVVRNSLMVGCQSSDRAGMPTTLNLAWEKAH